MDPLKIMKKTYEQRDSAALEWKKNGGKIVGYMCTQVPDELITAAGFFPYRLSGDPKSGTEGADKFTEPFYEAFVRSMFNMLLTGRYDFLDYLVIPHARDSVQALYSLLNEVKGLRPDLKFPVLYLFDSLHTRSWLSGRYMHDRVVDFRNKLEEWSGKPISSEELSTAIAIGNENRSLLKKVQALRADVPSRISGTDALQIIGVSMFMVKEKHNALLSQFLRDTDRWLPRKGARLFVEGSPMDNLQFYQIVESCNATIVAEDNCWGNRYSDTPVAVNMEPLEALAERYHLKSPCPRMHPLQSRVDYCVQSALDAKANGVVFNILDYDYAQTWETPDEVNALKNIGMPFLVLKNQKYLLSAQEKEKILTNIREFVDSISESLEK